jgi:transcription elongation factor GreB
VSKAFTKESDDGGVEDLIPGPKDPLPPGVKNYITPEGAARLKRELKELIEASRPAAAALRDDATGDRRRNLQAIDRRIRFLADRIANLEIVPTGIPSHDRVRFGARVTVADENGVEKTYRIVGVDESDPAAGEVELHIPHRQGPSLAACRRCGDGRASRGTQELRDSGPGIPLKNRRAMVTKSGASSQVGSTGSERPERSARPVLE